MHVNGNATACTGLEDLRLAEIEAKLASLGVTLPDPIQVPAGVTLPFSWVRRHGDRVYVSGHIALNDDGSLAQPLGKVGAEVSEEEGYQAARKVALAILASLQRELGDLDRIEAWLKALGMVNSAPDFNRYPVVINGFSDLIIELFGSERGDHARSAVGLAGLPFGTPVEIEAEVLIKV
jgi:enamine deaminase RidA (YjgF/YER057c/UK114 family)